MSVQTLSMTKTVSNGDVVVTLSGRFDFSANSRFRAMLEDVFSVNPKSLSFDFSGVDYMDSSALGMLLVVKDRLSSMKLPRPAIRGARGAAAEILSIANFQRIFEIS